MDCITEEDVSAVLSTLNIVNGLDMASYNKINITQPSLNPYLLHLLHYGA